MQSDSQVLRKLLPVILSLRIYGGANRQKVEEEKHRKSDNTDLFTLAVYWVSGSPERSGACDVLNKCVVPGFAYFYKYKSIPLFIVPSFVFTEFFPISALGTIYATSWIVFKVLLILCHYYAQTSALLYYYYHVSILWEVALGYLAW